MLASTYPLSFIHSFDDEHSVTGRCDLAPSHYTPTCCTRHHTLDSHTPPGRRGAGTMQFCLSTARYVPCSCRRASPRSCDMLAALWCMMTTWRAPMCTDKPQYRGRSGGTKARLTHKRLILLPGLGRIGRCQDAKYIKLNLA